MASLIARTVKAKTYYYWHSTTRSRRKYGGSGRVQSFDICLGSGLRYLGYYVWTEQVPFPAFAEQMILKYVCPESWKNLVQVVIVWKPKPKVSLHSRFHGLFKDVFGKGLYGVDCRGKFWRKQRSILQGYLDNLCQRVKHIQEFLEEGAYQLGKYDRYVEIAEQARRDSQEIRKDPNRTWTEWVSIEDSETGCWTREKVNCHWVKDAEYILADEASRFESYAGQSLERYQQILEQTVAQAPARKRLEFRKSILGSIQRLSKNQRWLEKYEVERK